MPAKLMTYCTSSIGMTEGQVRRFKDEVRRAERPIRVRQSSDDIYQRRKQILITGINDVGEIVGEIMCRVKVDNRWMTPKKAKKLMVAVGATIVRKSTYYAE